MKSIKQKLEITKIYAYFKKHVLIIYQSESSAVLGLDNKLTLLVSFAYKEYKLASTDSFIYTMIYAKIPGIILEK